MRHRLFHIITGLDAGGAEMSLYKLLKTMDRRSFESRVASLLGDGSIGARIRELGIPVYDLGMRRSRPSALGLGRLVRLLRRERPTLVQTWLYHADLLGTIATRITLGPELLWNVRASNMEMKKYNFLSGLTVRVCARMSGLPRAVVVNSEAGRAFHEAMGYRPKEWVVIPNGFDLDEFRPDPGARASVREELGIGPETPLIGLVGRFDPMKDHENFVRAAGRLGATRTDAHFLMVGAGVTMDNSTLSEMIRRAAPDVRFHCLGQRADVPRLTAALDIASSSSSYGEGFSNTVGEAMACGVPCVVTDVGDSAIVVGETGVVVPPRDPVALEDGLRRLMEMGRDGRRSLGELARERIRARYSLDTMARRYEETYYRMLDATPRRGQGSSPCAG